MTYEVISSFSKKLGKRGYMAIKLEMEKSVWSLKLRFIKKCFTHLGLSNRYD